MSKFRDFRQDMVDSVSLRFVNHAVGSLFLFAYLFRGLYWIIAGALSVVGWMALPFGLLLFVFSTLTLLFAHPLITHATSWHCLFVGFGMMLCGVGTASLLLAGDAILCAMGRYAYAVFDKDPSTIPPPRKFGGGGQ